MGFRFRKSFTIFKGLKANVSNSGVSFTIGGKGASINTGKRGTYVNLGIPGTGISYRQRLDSKPNNKSNKDYKSVDSKQEKKNKEKVEQFNEVYDQLVFIHKYANNVESYEVFASHLANLTDETAKQSLISLIQGNSQMISLAIDNYISCLNPPYDCALSYQLDDDTVFLDVDLPEIVSMPTEYPTMLKDGSILTKKFAQTTIRQNYANTVLSLAIYLASSIFNISPYIKKIIISGYTQVRNKLGDAVDQYIYSVEFTRELFEHTNLSAIDKPYEFILRFNNRINLSSAYSFKEITPYVSFNEQQETINNNEPSEQTKQTDDIHIVFVKNALKSLGYKPAEINRILPALKEIPFVSEQDYLKQALILMRQ